MFLCDLVAVLEARAGTRLPLKTLRNAKVQSDAPLPREAQTPDSLATSPYSPYSPMTPHKLQLSPARSTADASSPHTTAAATSGSTVNDGGGTGKRPRVTLPGVNPHPRSTAAIMKNLNIAL